MYVGQAGLVNDELVVINQIHDNGTITIHNGRGTGFRTISKDKFNEV